MGGWGQKSPAEMTNAEIMTEVGRYVYHDECFKSRDDCECEAAYTYPEDVMPYVRQTIERGIIAVT